MSTGSNAAAGAGSGNAGFSSDATAAGPVAGFDPVLISLIRRAMPNLVAYDLAGVQPMSGPTGLIFAMRARYDGPATTNAETFYNEVNPNQSGTQGANDVSGAADALTGNNPAVLNDGFTGSNEATAQGYYGAPGAMGTEDSEGLDSDGSAPDFRQMGFSIEKISVTAKSRALKADYSIELAQDLRAIHGLDAESGWQTFCPLRSLLRSTEKLSEPSISPLSVVLSTTPLPLVLSTSTLTPTVVGQLRSSKDFCSKSSVMRTQSHAKLVEERAT